MTIPEPLHDLLDRSHRLGSDPRTTNYGGGNTSATGTIVDPASGEPVEVVWVKGSGGDLGTLRADGVAAIRRDRFEGLRSVYRGPEHEDEMVALFAYTLHGAGGAAPSIDTSMHVLVDAAHVDHLHPDAGIAIATSLDGERLTAQIFGDTVLWIPWRRPGFQLGLDVAEAQRENPDAIGAILGGHGITAWGPSSAECERRSLEIISRIEAYLAEHGRADPIGAVVPGRSAPGELERRARAAAIIPRLRGLASTDERMVGHLIDDDDVLDFVSRERAAELAARGSCCPDHYLRTKVAPMFVQVDASTPIDEVLARIEEAHAAYRAEYAAYYERNADSDSPPMRGADPRIVLVPGIGMVSFGKDKQTARVAGEYFVNTIAAIRGAESVSQYSPVPESEKFRIEYWSLEEAKLRRAPAPPPLTGRIAVVSGAAGGIGRAIAQRLAREGACVVLADLDQARAAEVAADIGGPDTAVPVAADMSDEAAIAVLVREAVLAFGGVDIVVNNAGLSIAKTLVDTTVADWDLLHDVMARGSFLLSREAARVLIAQELGGDVIYIASKNSVVAGPMNLAYSAAKADQAHQVRLLAAELGPHGVRVNGINPDGVVRDSGLFAAGWGADRARHYGVAPDKLGEYYASRTLLGLEVVPDDVANAVVALTAGELGKTTGLHVPVDAGVAAAFLR